MIKGLSEITDRINKHIVYISWSRWTHSTKGFTCQEVSYNRLLRSHGLDTTTTSIAAVPSPAPTDCRWELPTPMAPTQLEAPLPSCPVTLAAWPVGTASPQSTPPLRPHRQCLIRTRLGWHSPVPRGPRASHSVAAGASWAWLREGHCFPPPIPPPPPVVLVQWPWM